MTRFLLALIFAFVASASALAQDMPLSQILIDGAGWKKVDAPGKPPAHVRGNVQTYSADIGTRFIVVEGSPFLWAEPVVEGGSSSFRGAPYAPLRLKRGERTIAVTSLTTDRDGRIYAATEIGVQVFDPTGRMCGVLTPAAKGKPEHLAFEGDTLTLWIGETKYARKLRTEGVK